MELHYADVVTIKNTGDFMKINETIYSELPQELQKLFYKLPNPSKDEVVELFPVTPPSKRAKRNGNNVVGLTGMVAPRKFDWERVHDDSGGSAARFFYIAKPSKREKNEGLDGEVNSHATCKPIALMQHLVTLITPPNGKVLDPFMGSGTTGIACVKLGFNFIGIDLEEEYVEIAKKRIEYHTKENEDETNV